MALPRQYQATQSTTDLTTYLRGYPYLAKYIQQVVPEVGMPQFLGQEVPGSLRKVVKVNVIYTVDDGIFIHVYTPPRGTESGYRKYAIVEPPRPPSELLRAIEEKIAAVLSERDASTSLSDRREILLKALGKVVEVVGAPVNYREVLSRGLNKLKTIPIYSADYRYVVYHLVRDKAGLGMLEPLLKDRYIEDIYCNGVGYVFIVHKVFGPLETSLRFSTQEELDKFIIELSERIGKPVSHARPIVDATLPDGSRINIVFGGDVSLRGSSFTIRKFSKIPMSVTEIVNLGTMDEFVAAYLWMLLLEGMSGFVSGETASGKTTTLNAITVFIRPTAKIVSIEDTAEIQLPHENWLRELTRDTGSVETSVTMFDLLKAALRQRPNYIIVGEIRGLRVT